MANLRTKVGTLELKNPILVGSATPTWDGARSNRAVLCGAGASVLKTLCPKGEECQHPQNGRFVVIKVGNQPIGMVDYELFSTFSEQQWLTKELKNAKEGGATIVASTLAAADPAVTAELIRDVSKTGLVDAIELNNSCPMHVNMRDWNIASLTVEQVSAARKATDLPLWVKFPSTTTTLADGVRAAEACGADALVIGNSMSGFGGVDIDTGRPRMGAIGGYGGAAIKPIMQAKVIEVLQASSLPVVAVGGVNCWQDVVEYIMLGASAVQTVSAIMWNGFEMLQKMNEQISRFMDEHGYASIEQMRGVALPFVGEYDALLGKPAMAAEIIPEACTACGRCERTCFYDAISKVDGKMQVDRSKCDGCGLCAQLCRFGGVKLTQKA